MKLTNLNCPQCSGLLNQERDMFFCSSCGAGFNVDYDEHDVKYAQYVTQASRSKLEVARDIDIMRTESALKEAALDNKLQREMERSNKTLRSSIIRTIVTYTLSSALIIGSLIGIAVFAGKLINASRAKDAATTKSKMELLTEKVSTDEVFLDNVIMAGRDFAYRNNRALTYLPQGYPLPEGQVELTGVPELIAIYSIPSKNYTGKMDVHLVYKLTFKYEDSDTTIDMYQHASTVAELNKYDEVKSEYVMSTGAYDHIWNKGVFYEPEQLYRECILPMDRTTEVNEISIPEDWEVAR